MRNLSTIGLGLLVVHSVLSLQASASNHAHHNHHRHHTKLSVKSDEKCGEHPHRVESLPYWNKDYAFPCMYAGTFNVSQTESEDHNLFYWFFKNTTLENPPLLLWLNGGPGATSMFGLFQENGPLRVNRTGSGPDDYSLGLSKFGHWTELADVIFMDQPVGTGFSYGGPLLERMDKGALEVVDFLVKFIKEYPEYNNRDFYLTGESYSGKYLPHIAYQIKQYMRKVIDNDPIDKQINITLKAALIGNPFVSPIRQRTSTHNVAVGVGIADTENLGQIAALRRRCEETVSTDWSKGSAACTQTMDYIDAVAGGVYTYDGSIFDYDWEPIQNMVDEFLASCGKVKDLYEAIHINGSTKVPIYEPDSEKVAQAYDYEEMLDWSRYYDMALEEKVPMIVYAGEYDQRDGPTTQEAWMRDLEVLKQSDDLFWNQARKIYYIKNDDGSYQVGGYYRYDPIKQFTFLSIPKAGHFVPTFNPVAARQMLKDYLEHQQLLCHKDNATDCETAPIMCNWMNNCSGNGACDLTGKCTCNKGWKGADCAEKVEMLSNQYAQTFTANGTQWVFFQYTDGLQQNEEFELFLSSSHVMDVYILKGEKGEPSEFKNDIEIRKQNYLKISSSAFPSLSRFVAAVRVNGILYNGNVFQNTTLRAQFSKGIKSVKKDDGVAVKVQQTRSEDRANAAVSSFFKYLALGGAGSIFLIALLVRLSAKKTVTPQ